MNYKNQIEQFNAHLENKYYQEAFAILVNFPAYLVHEVLKPNLKRKLNQQKLTQENWGIFFKTCSNHAIFKTEWIHHLLHDFWKRFDINSVENLKIFYQTDEQLLINSIRLNQVFLDPQKFNIIKSELDNKPTEIYRHLQIMELLLNHKNDLIIKTAIYWKALNDLNCIEVITDIACWQIKKQFEFEKEKGNFTAEWTVALNHHFLSINKFLNEYLKNGHELPSQMDIQEIYMKRFAFFLKSANSPVWSILDIYSEELLVLEDEIDRYSYNMFWDFDLIGNTIQWKCTDNTEENNWNKGAKKIEIWQHHLLKEQNIEAKRILEDNCYNLYIPNELNYVMNIYGKVNSESIKKVMQYMHFSDKVEPEIADITKILNDYYNNSLFKFKLHWNRHIERARTWFELVFNILHETASKGFLIKNIREDEFNSKIRNQQAGLHSIQTCNKYLGTDISEPLNKEEIDIISKPFLKINNQIIYLPNILANSNIPIAIANNLIKSKSLERMENFVPKEKKLIEDEIAKWLNENGIQSKAQVEIKPIPEIDVVGIWGNDILLIEAKRNQLHTNDKGIHSEKSTLLKASIQLHRNENLIIEHFDEFKKELKLNIDLSNVQIHKLIVSTSFENDHKLLEGIIKISTFELKEILYNHRECNNKEVNNPIENLMDKINENYFWEKMV